MLTAAAAERSCGCGTGCASGCGTGIASGPGCSGSNRPGPPPKKPAANSDDNFVPRPSPPYDDQPPAGRRRKAPRTPPADAGPTGGPAAGNDFAPPSESSAAGFKRGQGNEQGSASATKGPAGDSPEFKSPTPPKGQDNTPAGEGTPFNARKPVSPPPKQPAKKKAPVKNPDSAFNESGSYRLTSTGRSDESDPASNPALGLQERPTWSYATPHHFTAGRLAHLTVPATPRRLKSESIERVADPVETKAGAQLKSPASGTGTDRLSRRSQNRTGATRTRRSECSSQSDSAAASFLVGLQAKKAGSTGTASGRAAGR